MIDLVEEKVIEQHNDLTDYEHVDPIQLSVYGHRLMGIAEQVCSVDILQLIPRTHLGVDGRHPAQDLDIGKHQRTT